LGSPTNLAAALGITEMAVRKWLLRLTHPSNVNLSKMIEIAAGLDAGQLNEIIRDDLAKHQAGFAIMEGRSAFDKQNHRPSFGKQG